MNRTPTVISAALALAAAAPMAAAQIRVASWNVTTYSSGRVAEFQTAFFAQAPNGLQFWPDVIIAQEIKGTTAAANFRNLLNGYTDARGPGPRDYAMAPNSGATENAMFYRTSRVQLIGPVVTLSTGTGSCPTCPPRDNDRYLVRLTGYNAPAVPGTGPELYLYSAHMKAGGTAADQARRTPESIRLRSDTNALPANANFILGGDFNIQSSGQTAYQNLIGGPLVGRFIDPINTPGAWNNNCSFKWVFTQDPGLSATSQLDDRLDFLLISEALKNGGGLDYIGDTTANFNTWCANNNSWDNPQHSYRCWGNDGFICNSNLRVTGNSMVGPVIAEALAASALSTGHLPVYLDLRIPPRIAATTVVNLGSIAAGTQTTATLTVTNNTDVRTFARNPTTAASAGIESLNYSFAAIPAELSLAGGNGPFVLAPLNQAPLPAAQVFSSRTHTLNFTAPSAVGSFTRAITLSSNSDSPAISILVTATITPAPCSAADVNSDGTVDGTDFITFVNSFGVGEAIVDAAADVNNDGTIDGSDFIEFINAFAIGC